MPNVSMVSGYQALQLADDLPESYASKNLEGWEDMQSLFIKYRFKPSAESKTNVTLLLVNRNRYASEGRKILAASFDKVCLYSDWGKAIERAETIPEHLRTMLPKHFMLAVPYIIYKTKGYCTYVPAGMDEHTDMAPWAKRAGRLQWHRIRPVETFSFGKQDMASFMNKGTRLYQHPSVLDRNMLLQADLDEALGGMML